MRTLLVMTSALVRLPKAELQRLEAAGERPRTLLLEDQLSADVLDAEHFRNLPGALRLLYRPLPGWVAQTLEAFRLRRRYDAVVTWDDRVALFYPVLLGAIRSRARHIALVSWMGPVRKGTMLRRVQKRIDRVVVWTRFHGDLLAELYSIEQRRIALVPYWVDQQFFAPREVEQDSICAVGDSKRDYRTLLDALADLAVPCRIVTQAVVRRDAASDWGVTGQNLDGTGVPEHVTVAPASSLELRDVYARSRFVVVPLFPGLRDHGITSAVEAMAMGKAVICSQTDGLAGIVDDGVTGLLVPPGDAQSLRAAIQRLWDQPELAQRMGTEGRRRVEEHYRLDLFVAGVKQAVVDALADGKPVPDASGASAAPVVATRA